MPDPGEVQSGKVYRVGVDKPENLFDALALGGYVVNFLLAMYGTGLQGDVTQAQ